jgi:ADP-heptose:LPS heptosyltransferase
MNIKELQPKNILLIWIGKVGDFVVSTPFIKSVRDACPDAHISLMVTKPVAPLAEIVYGVDEVIAFPKQLSTFSCIPAFIKKFYFRKWDVCIDMNPSYSKSAGALTRKSKAPVRVSFDNDKADQFYTDVVARPKNTEHMMLRYQRLADFFEMPFNREMKILPREQDFAKADVIRAELGLDCDKKTIVLHPGNFKKEYSCWPEEHFISISKLALDEYDDIELVYLAGPGEEERVDAMVAKIGAGAKRAPLMPLPVTAAFLERASLMVVNSTGTLHMAEGVGTPTLSFHKQYSYLCWRPLDTIGAALDSEDWNTVRVLPMEKGWEAFREVYPRIK